MKRLSLLQDWMKRHHLPSLLIENPIDLFYLTSLQVSTGKLLVLPQNAALFLDARYSEKAKKEQSLPVFLPPFLKDHLPQKVAFDSSFTSYDAYLKYKTDFPHIEWIPHPKPLKTLRLFKDPQEISHLRKAAQITSQGYQHIRSLLKEGVLEKDLALEFEFFAKRHGADRLSFEPIIAFGENSAYPHHRAGTAPLKANQIVLMDLGAVKNGYAGDMTRTFFFGRENPRLASFYKWVKEAHDEAINQIRPGTKIVDLDKTARAVFEREGVVNLFPHSLGHGIGLETHEYPLIRTDFPDQELLIEPNMVFTIEPGLYEPGLGGVRYEDTLLVTEEGSENFYENF